VSIRARAVVAVLAVSLAAPRATFAGMRDCVERGGVWLESGRCELPDDDEAAQCRRQGGRWLSSSGRCEVTPVDWDEECKKKPGGVGMHDGKCYRFRTREERERDAR
jgi:hypothetical protein